METLTDPELITKAQAGDRRAFAALVDRHYGTAYRFAFKWSHTREDAEDIAQEVFIKLAAKIDRFDHRAKFTTWLYQITANAAMDHARKNSRWTANKLPDPPDDDLCASPNPGPENNIIAKSILKAVHELPDTLKQAMLLVYAEGMNHAEAAKAMGCAETTVSWRIFQAKRKLRKVLS